MKNTNSKFYNGIDKDFVDELRFKSTQIKCATLADQSSLVPNLLGELDSLQDKLACRIIVVDDKKVNLLFIENLLKAEGYKNILCLIDSREVEKNLTSFDPDLLILDLLMPNLNGIDILNQINNTKTSLNYLPVLILTAANGSSMMQAAFEAGANDFLSRPCDKFELLLRVNNLLETRILNQILHKDRNILKEFNNANAKELEKALNQISQNQEEALLMIGSMLEHNDFETKGHIKRVCKLALDLARALGVDEQDLIDLRWGAYLHDIGKITTSESVLLKPEKLTIDEYEEVKKHVIIGETMLKELSFIPKAVIEIVKHHHERWDGMGYPYSLAAENIPFLARIFAVVDVYDALLSERPYKKAWSVEEAEQELRRQKHKQFDPEVVDAFLQINKDTAAELEMVEA